MIATAVVGAVVLGVSLRVDPGSTWFYPATLGLAAVWALGALASGALPLGRPTLAPVLVGLGLAGVFVVGGLVVREIEPLAEQVRKVIDYADQGSLPVLVLVTAVNGVAEELFFRGAAYDAVPRHPVVWTALANAAATAAAGNVMLAFAALVLGIVVGIERARTGTLMAPILTHVTWSVSMLLALPFLFGA
ncbi:MAG: CPBP family intramembrane metalloprotease [Actinomycetota bacterium]|nr:CPBP family intramembrane metalloprotease [Actinomycetota bacterium]